MNGTETEITDFEIVDGSIKAELKTRSRETLTWCPYWNVELYLDRSYPGDVYAIQVGIWADSGEVFLCKQIGVGGAITPEDLDAAEIPETGASPVVYIAAIVGLVTLIAAVMVVYKKRSK
jgi:hypothetical protein